MVLPRTLGALLLTASIASAANAGAGAAADVRELRAGALPARYDWLGWDAAGHAHFRKLVCSSGGTVSCRAALVDLTPDAPARATELLDVAEVYCDPGSPCSALTPKTVASFVAAERRALSALSPTTKTMPVSDPAAIFGTIAGEPTRVEVTAFRLSDDESRVVVRLVARGKGDAREDLGTLAERVTRLDHAGLNGAYLSPDGRSAAVVASIQTTTMCWDSRDISMVSVNLPRHRASLANTIGFRAWKKNDMPAALAAFREATQHDASFALGWYNRAAVESRTGAVDAAAASFREATSLDLKLARRACNDHDFDPLRASTPSIIACP
jgi:hypothetical protein